MRIFDFRFLIGDWKKTAVLPFNLKSKI